MSGLMNCNLMRFTLFRKGYSVTYVLNQMCYLCLEPVPGR